MGAAALARIIGCGAILPLFFAFKIASPPSSQAADIGVPGISKSSLARYLRSRPGRVGIGLYCRSRSVHIDIGPKRQWYWGCGKKKRSRRS